MAAMKIYLHAIKEVYQQLRSEVNADKGLSEAELDSVFPIIVSLPKYDEMKTFGNKPFQGDEVPLPVEIQFFSNDGTASKLLKNISLKELKEAIVAYKAAAGGNEAFTVNFKVTSDDIKMGTVMAVKETIRKAYYGQ